MINEKNIKTAWFNMLLFFIVGTISFIFKDFYYYLSMFIISLYLSIQIFFYYIFKIIKNRMRNKKNG